MGDDADASGRARRVRLAETLATRLCHDLSGPLGALGAALGEVGADPEALPLAQEAAAVLHARLALLRAAWGAAPPGLTGAALADLARGLTNAHRLRLELDPKLRAGAFAPPFARLVLNAILLASESLPMGGTIGLAGDPAREVMVSIVGPRAAWPEGLGRLLADPEATWDALDAIGEALPGRRFQAVLTALVAEAAGAEARLLLGPRPEAAPPLVLRLTSAA
jgi:histidine phosphotransferase ChpT